MFLRTKRRFVAASLGQASSVRCLQQPPFCIHSRSQTTATHGLTEDQQEFKVQPCSTLRGGWRNSPSAESQALCRWLLTSLREKSFCLSLQSGMLKNTFLWTSSELLLSWALAASLLATTLVRCWSSVRDLCNNRSLGSFFATRIVLAYVLLES